MRLSRPLNWQFPCCDAAVFFFKDAKLFCLENMRWRQNKTNNNNNTANFAALFHSCSFTLVLCVRCSTHFCVTFISSPQINQRQPWTSSCVHIVTASGCHLLILFLFIITILYPLKTWHIRLSLQHVCYVSVHHHQLVSSSGCRKGQPL